MEENNVAQTIFILIFITIIALGMMWIVWDYTSSEENNKENAAVIEISNMYAEYLENEVKAKPKYIDNYFIFENIVIDKIESADVVDTPIIYSSFTYKDKKQDITIYFLGKDKEAISNLKPGDKISIKAKVKSVDTLLFDIALTSAEIIQ